MKNVFLTFSAFSTLFLFSCQKEIDYSDVVLNNNNGNTGGNNNTGTKLVKMVSKSGADSSVVNFTYNSSGKLTAINLSGIGSGVILDSRETFIRNSQGIIQKRIIKRAEFLQYGIDSVIANVNYDANTARYKSWALSYNLSGAVLRDSLFLIYDTNGKIITGLGYGDNGSGVYVHTAKLEYTYSGNNLVSKKLSTFESGIYTEDFTVTDEFDAKTSPLILGNEAFVLNEFGSYFSSNNVSKETVTYPASPTETRTVSYIYNSSNKPLSASSQILPGNTNYTTAYFYQ